MHRVLVPDGTMLKPEQFNATYGGHMFQMMPDGTQPTRKAFEALTENRATTFPQAIRPCFRPDLPPHMITEDGSVNTYIPPDVQMVQGDVGPFLDLLARLLPDPGDRAIMLAYMAAVVQYPGHKFQWAPVLQGCEGNGKTALFSCVIYAVGRRYTHQPKAKQLGAQFNAYLDGKIFILVEEIHMNGRREILDDLKPLITNSAIEVEGKGVDQRMIENRANWAFCTNYQDAVLKSRNDRRYAIFFTAQQSKADIIRDGMGGQYFPDLWDWFRGGGWAKVAWFLKHYDIPDALNPAGACHRAPDTTSTNAAIERSQGGLESEIVEASENNTPGFRGGWVSTVALDRLIKQLGYRIGRNKYESILVDLGYQWWGRASTAIMNEDGKRPMLYAKPDVDTGFGAYERAQNYPSA